MTADQLGTTVHGLIKVELAQFAFITFVEYSAYDVLHGLLSEYFSHS